MNDLISIIIPVYNRQNVLEACVHSIQAQSYQNFEIILIDDGSTDQTPQVCRKLAEEDPRIRLLGGDHAGVSAARNKGLDAAKGAYIFFVDSDDVVHPLLAETLIDGMVRNDSPIGGSKYHPIRNSEWDTVHQIIASDPGPGQTTFHSCVDSIRSTCYGQSPFSTMGGVMIRRDLIGQTRFRTDLFIGEDFYFIYENFLKGASSVFLEQKWYYCRIHPGNSSNNFSFPGFMTRFCRRRLVWRSEAALGRTENAIRQKQDAFGIFLKCLKMGRMGRGDIKKMCNVMKEHKAEILPALNLTRKLRFYLHVYFPSTIRLTKLKKK